jgi:hypothetical protein
LNSARERYRFLRHSERLLLWQIATAERERAIRKRTFKRAWLALPLNIALRIVIADNINLYNRTKNWKP